MDGVSMVDEDGNPQAPDPNIQLSLQRSADGTRVRTNEYNAWMMMHDPRWAGRIYYDELERNRMLDGRSVTDEDITGIQLWCSSVYDLDFTDTKIRAAVNLVARQRSHHPVQTYLKSLDKTDGSLAESFLTEYLGCEDTPLTRAYSKRWLLSAAWRALKPGCKADCVLVLYGAQGVGKSTGLQALAGYDWFGDSPLKVGDDQKVGMTIRGKWIYELGELSSMRKAEADEMKALVSQQFDDYRAPWGRTNERHPRTMVMAGTTNDLVILRDSTGSRRFWVVKAGAVSMDKIMRDRDEIWASVMTLVRRALGGRPLEEIQGMSMADFFLWSRNLPPDLRWWLTPEEDAERAAMSSTWESTDPWSDTLIELFDGAPGHPWTGEGYSPGRESYFQKHLLEHLRVDGARGHAATSRLAKLMAQLGWTKYKSMGRTAWKITAEGQASAAERRGGR